MIFKKEYKQLSKDVDKSENACQSAWSQLDKDTKKCYNIYADKDNKTIKDYYNKRKISHKKNEETKSENKDKNKK